MSQDHFHKPHLDHAARLALRAAGDVEPNPLVGCIIVKDGGGEVIGAGHHRRFGGPHAEVEALADCARRGENPRNSTIYITLEPCAHHGKQPPCTDALIQARPARVICARRDPHPHAQGGAERLRQAGIEVLFTHESPLATRISDPFIKRTTTGLPWVIAKWAQTIDGRIATKTGQSQWISSEFSRRAVHRLRARVDAILTGIGTIKADNPRLTPRGVARIRRMPRRVVIDPFLETPADCMLLRSLNQAPVTIACAERLLAARAATRDALTARGVELLPLPGPPDDLDLKTLLQHLVTAHSATNVLVEAGANTLGGLLRAGLVDEALVYVAPMLLGDAKATPAVTGCDAPTLAAAHRFELTRAQRLGPDIVLCYRRSQPAVLHGR